MPGGKHVTDGISRGSRRKKLLETCLAFIQTVCAQSDELVRQGRQRSGLAQTQYELAQQLASDIENELAVGGAQYDENRNYARERREGLGGAGPAQRRERGEVSGRYKASDDDGRGIATGKFAGPGGRGPSGVSSDS